MLARIAAAGVDDRYCLGDLVGYARWPNETLELLQREDTRSSWATTTTACACIRTLKPAGIRRSWPHRNNRTQSDSTGGSPRFRYAVPSLISADLSTNSVLFSRRTLIRTLICRCTLTRR